MNEIMKEYIPLDFYQLQENILSQYPILQSYAKDRHFQGFIESLQDNYIVLLQKENATTIPTFFITHKSLMVFLQSIKEATKNVCYEYEIEITKLNNIYPLVYYCQYKLESKDIFLYIYNITFQKIQNVFTTKRKWHKYSYIIKENDTLIINNKKIIYTEKKQCFNDELLRNYYLQRIQTPLIKDLKNLTTEQLNHLLIDFSIIKNAHTIQELIENALQQKIAYNLNRLHIFIALSFGIALRFILENERNTIYQFLLQKDIWQAYNKNHIDIIETIKIKRKKFHWIDILKIFLTYRIQPQTDEDKDLIADYLKLIYATNSIVNLHIRSIKRIQHEHNLLLEKLHSMQIKKRKLKIDTCLKALKLPPNFILIKTNIDLFLQGKKEHNCVYTRMNRIESGKCAIYNVLYNGLNYTLEIGKRKDKYVIAELKGRFNETPNKEVKKYVAQTIKAINYNITKT